MKFSTLNLLVAFLCCGGLLLISCRNDDGFPLKHPFFPDLRDCHAESEWDSLKITAGLSGEWRWFGRSCIFGDNSDTLTFKSRIYEFKSDGTLAITTDDGVFIRDGEWKVFRSSDGNFEMEGTPFLSETTGLIKLCENDVSFDKTQIDDCIHYYSRKE